MSVPAAPFGRDVIESLIPHRAPFLLVDKILELEPGKRVVGIREIRADDWWFPGHFPERPVMPGVLIIESMAQTAAVLVVETLGGDAAGKLVYFMSIEGAKFRRPVVPGDQVHLKVKKDRQRGNVWKFRGEAYVDNVLCAEAAYTAMLVPKDELNASTEG